MFKLSYPKEHKFIYATSGSVGFDICANEDAHILPGNWALIATGLFIEEATPQYLVDAIFQPMGRTDNPIMSHKIELLPELQIRCRSGLAIKCGITVLGGVNTIDPDARGEIFVPLKNEGQKAWTVSKGDRIAQGVCVLTYQLKDSCAVLENVRGAKGFGSTGY